MRRRHTGLLFSILIAILLLCLPAIAGQGTDVDDETEIRRYARGSYVWPYSSGPHYGAVVEGFRREAGVLYTEVGSFRLEQGLPFPVELAIANQLDTLGAQYFVVQLEPDAAAKGGYLALKRLLEERGGGIERPLPTTAYVVRLDGESLRAIRVMPGLHAVEPYHPAFKLHPTIGRTPLMDADKAVSSIYDLEIELFSGESVDEVASRLARLGAHVIATRTAWVRADVPRSVLADVARIEGVDRILEHVPMTIQGEKTTVSIQTGRYGSGYAPFHVAGIDGGGQGQGNDPQSDAQRIMVLDTGIQLDAADLADTRTSTGVPGHDPANAANSDVHRKVLVNESTDQFGGAGDLLGCESGLTTHGHVVAATALGWATDELPGTWGGDGFTSPDFAGKHWKLDGVAPKALLVNYDAQVTGGRCQNLEPGELYDEFAGGSLGTSYNQHNAKLANFSWGSNATTYSTNSSLIDEFLFENKDAMVFIASGNTSCNGILLIGARTDDEPGGPRRHVRAQRPGTGETGGGEHGVFGGFGDALVLGHPATAKNALTIGASGAVNDFGPAAEETRACFSRVGPDPANPAQAGLMGGRIAPQLMAPGLDIGSLGLPSEFSCKSSDDDQSSPVECINTFGWPGTSFSAPAVTGAAALVRDYFAQGFFPDGTGNNPGNDNDEIGNVSGSLVKAILINSADFLSCNGRNDFLTLRAGRTRDCPRESYLKDRYRFNHEQGYGRVKLDNALPLENWSPSASCLRVKDTSPPFFVSNIDGPDATAQTIDAVAGETHTMTFDVNHRRKELRITLAWLDEPGVALINDLDLELISPSGRVYFGNFFTEDDDRDGVLSTVGPDAEDCGGFDCPGCSGNGVLEESEWSLPLCFRDDLFPRHDHANPTEAIFLSPDPDGDFKTLDAHNQIELGTWILEVRANGGGTEAALPYALAISGPTCAQSQIAWVDDAFSCSGTAGFTLIEADESGDAVGGLTTAEVESRLVVQVIDSTGSILDEEAFFVPLGQSLTLESGSTWTGDFPLSGETARDAYNGVLDVRHGDIVRLVYADENNGLADPDRVRNAEALVNCRVDLSLSSLSFNTFGTNLKTEVRGGCERNERVTHRCAGDPQISCTSNSNCGGNGPCSSTGANTFDFGAPDPYLDAGESVVLGVAVEPRADVDLHHLEASLRCVEVNDITADEDCAPGSPSRVGCTDPLRESHTPCPGYMTIFNSPSTIDYAAAGQPVALEFPIQMANFISGEPDVEFVLDVTARASGKTAEGTVVARKRLDVDEVCKAYSTDYLTGGTEVRDYNNNQLIEYLTESDDYNQDYRFETRVFEDATVTGKNLGLQTPWNFDLNDGGFRSGLGDETDESTIADTIAQWGEDKNFNNVEDRRCNGNPLVSCAVNLDCINLNAGTQCVADEDRDPFNGQLDQNWSTLGGCGWQTKAPGSCALNPNIFCYTDDDCVPFGAGTCTGSEPVTGGAWHTGRIGGTSGACLVQGNMPGQCQTFETISGSTGESLWFELLLTPVIERVNADSAVRITHWGWNQSIDLPDEHTCMTWEFDVDVDDGREDLTRDLTVLNFIAGPYGPVTDTGGWKNPDGYPAFAPLDAQGNSQNGTSADIVQPPSTVITTNRHGKNSCFFESGVVPDTRDELALAGPPDDDLSNGYCKEPPFKSCLPGTCGDAGPCIIASPFIDEHVRPWGPERNMDASSFFGPDLRFATLEDIYGATGARFQAGLGLITFEKPGPADADPQAGFGVAIDDMVIEWEECTQGADAVDCSLQGWCATASLDSRRLFAGSGRLRITVLEPSHDQNTDCDLDGVGDGTDNCDADSVREIAVEVRSDAEQDPGERLLLEETDPGSDIYTGSIPYSVFHDTPGTLFAQTDSLNLPAVTVVYDDDDDGTGNACPTAVEAQTRLVLPTGDLRVIGTVLADNGDDDGWADTNETVDMAITVRNLSGIDLSGVRAQLMTDDDKIDCIVDPSIQVGDLAAGETKTTVGSFRFRVAAVDRSLSGLTTFDDFSAAFDVTLSSDQLDGAGRAQRITLDLDLDAAPGSGANEFFEGFEVGSGLGSFTTMNLDFGMQSGDPEANADGYRCQYSDPDWLNSNSYGLIEGCSPGASPAQADAFFWQVHDPGQIDGGKAYGGTRSLYMGVFGAASDEHTTPLGILEAVAIAQPVNLDIDPFDPPILSFKHQISVGDDRLLATSFGSTGDRAIVQVQLADGSGNSVGYWTTIDPMENGYDSQASRELSNCSFDPVDDGSTEDDYFVPADPDRRLGPSSSCYPRYVFSYLGDTFDAFDPAALGNAEGPGLAGTVGSGTWVESSFNLERYRGKRIRVRFLFTSSRERDVETYEQRLSLNPDRRDDGWWIDDVRITRALTIPATQTGDHAANAGLEQCAACSPPAADLVATPAAADSPGQVVRLDASGSAPVACPDGVLQFRFRSNVDGVLRDFTDAATLFDVASVAKTYTVDVRCSSDVSCVASANASVAVDCPTGPGSTISFGDKSAFSWFGSVDRLFYAQGRLSTLDVSRTPDGSGSTSSTCGPVGGGAHCVTDVNPDPTDGAWWLVRSFGELGAYCNLTWSSGGSGEFPGRDFSALP